MATTGVVGQRWRAAVTSAGFIEPTDGSPALGWYVAADDRWHDPQTDPSVRHHRLLGTAVFETRMRVPGGDAVQRIWSVADRGGFTLLSVHNDSPAPFAVAFTRRDVATSRPIVDVPIDGIELPVESIVVPVGHRTTITVGLAHRRDGPAILPGELPSAEAVIRGWITRTEVASRLDVPDQVLVESVTAARCELLLAGVDDPHTEPERHLLGLGELVRLGDLDSENAAAAASGVAAAVTIAARRDDELLDASLDAAALVLSAAGEHRALADLARLQARSKTDFIPETTAPEACPVGVAAIPAVERRLLAGTALFPRGIPPRWRGIDLEAHGLIAGPDSRLSIAVRWHGAFPAVLWEADGAPIMLTATINGTPWSTTQSRGEELWRLGYRQEP